MLSHSFVPIYNKWYTPTDGPLVYTDSGFTIEKIMFMNQRKCIIPNEGVLTYTIDNSQNRLVLHGWHSGYAVSFDEDNNLTGFTSS